MEWIFNQFLGPKQIEDYRNRAVNYVAKSAYEYGKQKLTSARDSIAAWIEGDQRQQIAGPSSSVSRKPTLSNRSMPKYARKRRRTNRKRRGPKRRRLSRRRTRGGRRRSGSVRYQVRGTRRPKSASSLRFRKKARRIIDANIQTDKHPFTYTQRLRGLIGAPLYFTLMRPRCWDHLNQIATNYLLATGQVPVSASTTQDWRYDLVSHHAETQLTNTSNSNQRLTIFKCRVRRAILGGETTQYVPVGGVAAVNTANLPQTYVGDGGAGPQPDSWPTQLYANGLARSGSAASYVDPNYTLFDSIDFTRALKIISVTEKVILPGKTLMITDGSKKTETFNESQFTQTGVRSLTGATIYIARAIGLPINDTTTKNSTIAGAGALVSESQTWWDLQQRYSYNTKLSRSLFVGSQDYGEATVTGVSQANVTSVTLTAPEFTYQAYNLAAITPATS